MIFLFFFLLLLASIFYFNYSRRVPILMYHRIASITGDRNAVPPEKFHEQLYYLKQAGFHTISLSALYAFYTEQKPLPQKPVLLTFDDGYSDNLQTALPILKEFGFTAIVFPIGNWMGKENKWENFHKAPTKTMSVQELKIWQENGMEIAAHTMNHPFLTTLDDPRLSEELSASRQLLEREFSQTIDFLCYPYGKFNEKVKLAAQKSGYKGAFAIFENIPLWHTDLFALPRIQIPHKQKLWEFRLKVSCIHMIFIFLRQFERFCKRRLRRKN